MRPRLSFAHAGRGFVSSEIKYTQIHVCAMAGRSGRVLFRIIPWKGHSGSRQIVGIMLRFVVRGFRCEVPKLDCARLHEVEVWKFGGWSTIIYMVEKDARKFWQHLL